MQHTDLSEKFEKISDRAKAATDELKAAGDTTRDQLETEVAGARDKATAAADRFENQGRRRPRWRVVAVAGNPRQLALPRCQSTETRQKHRRHIRRAPGGARCQPGGGLRLRRDRLRAERDRRSRVRSADCHVCASQHRRAASLIAVPAGDYYD
jgi:hypothetical protein